MTENRFLTGDLELRRLAEMYWDTMKVRIANTNRAERGGVDAAAYSAGLTATRLAEDSFRAELIKRYRAVVPSPIRRWQRSTFGVGELLLARFLGHAGNPRLAVPYHREDGPAPADHVCDPLHCGKNRYGKEMHLVQDPTFWRSLREWYSYCGHGDPARQRRKGMSQSDTFALGNPAAKMLVHEMAEMVVREHYKTPGWEAKRSVKPPCSFPNCGWPTHARGLCNAHVLQERAGTALRPVRRTRPRPEVRGGRDVAARSASRHLCDVFDAGRRHYDTTHGDDWSPLHRMNAAKRLVAKRILRDLWKAD